MATERTCPKCGAVLLAGALGGLCAKCLGRAAFEVPLTAPGSSKPKLSEMSAEELEVEMARLKPEEGGEMIGPYKLREQVGEGGFGTVWVADQEVPVRRRVALKIIKMGMDTKEVIARFEQERQALALMDHPNIAKIFDAGATQWGRPYFVMELVRGIKITDYCDDQQLSTEERLALFITVCQAVQHAHQKGVIHRDLKPSNILVTINDGEAVPKIIDFGVAKATQGRLTDATVYTQFQQMVGTPLYMSPEQAELTSLDIDTRSDIYSLGVLLYELLTGQTPIDRNTLARAGMDEIRRLIREVDPPRPSMRLKTIDGNELTTLARRRHIDAAKLPASLRGDLDWIVMKCLEKDRKRRYDTANGLALDLRRYLNNEVITARPPTTTYLLGKLVRRNKLAFTAAGCVAVALLAGAILSTLQAIRATRAEARESHARKQAEIMNRFLRDDLLGESTPDRSAPKEARDAMALVLERASLKLEQDKEIAALPELEAKLRLAFGATYRKLGELAKAEHQLRRALAVREAAPVSNEVEILNAQDALAQFLVFDARKFEEGETRSRKAWQARKKLLGEKHPDTIESLATYFASIAMPGNRAEEAEPLGREVLRGREEVYGPNDLKTIDALDNLAFVRATLGQYAEAEQIGRQGLDRYRENGLLDKPEAMFAENNVAMFGAMQGKSKEAERLLREVLERCEKVRGKEHPQTLHLRHNLGRILVERGDLANAETLLRDTLAKRKIRTPDHEGYGRTLLILGRTLILNGGFSEANERLTEALAFYEEKYKREKPDLIAQTKFLLGHLTLEEKNYPKAEELMLPDSRELLNPTLELTPGERRFALQSLARLYREWGKPEQAAEWQTKLDESKATASATPQPQKN